MVQYSYSERGLNMRTNKNIMVCVTQQRTCERLIKAGAELRDERDGELLVIHVVPEGWNFLGKVREGDALEYLFEQAKSHGANLSVLRSNHVLETLKELAEKNEVDTIVLGESCEDREGNNIVSNLRKRLPEDIELVIVPTRIKRKAI